MRMCTLAQGCLVLGSFLGFLSSTASLVSASGHSQPQWSHRSQYVRAPSSEEPRMDMVFDYGWRFHFGHAPDGAPGPGDTTFGNISNFGCVNVEHNPNRHTPWDCMLACAYNPNCMVWQQDDVRRACYHGGKDARCSPQFEPWLPHGGERYQAPPIRTNYSFAERSFDDEKWQIVDTPHDFVVSGDFVNMTDTHHGFLPRNVSWYRKHFHLPDVWNSSHLAIHFEGIFHVAQVWLNGQYVHMHTCGYTGFTVRIDNVTGLEFGSDKTNVLSVRVDATFGSGHWYEGGGIYRRVHIIASNMVHFVEDGVFVSPEIATGDTIHASAEMENLGETPIKVVVSVAILTQDAKEKLVLNSTSPIVALTPNAAAPQLVYIAMDGSALKEQLWSVRHPNTFTLVVQLKDADSGTVLDVVIRPTGFRQTSWTSANGFQLNGEHIKFRGFSHHNSFTGVGVAIPDRVHLFRAQASRAVGGSFWRMSHNPYMPALYDYLDALGVLVWDENRDYGLEYVHAMHDMVKRDRNHPSIIVWSYCNEFECGQITNETGLAFRAATKALDSQRPTTANTNKAGNTDGLDVQGMSHAQNDSFVAYHTEYPDMPLVLSECCSCETQRLRRLSTTPCMHAQNSPGLQLPYVSGSLGVWTLFDYYGESHNWPSVTSSFGNFDLAGFPKPHAYWYQLNWLAMISNSDAGKPPVDSKVITRILTIPTQVYGGVAVLTSAHSVEVFLNNQSLGKQKSDGTGEPLQFSNKPACKFSPLPNLHCNKLDVTAGPANADQCAAACCNRVDCVMWQFTPSKKCFTGEVDDDFCVPIKADWPGGRRAPQAASTIQNITALSMDSSGTVLGQHTVLGADQASAVQLTLDVPSKSTGTGSALVLDGHDAALVRASIVDKNGVLVTDSSVNVTFRVVSGPARLIGVGNGDNYCHQNAKSDHVPAYGGLARALFQVTVDCLNLATAMIDVDQGPAKVEKCESHMESIVVEGRAAGLTSDQLSIPVSSDSTDLPLAVARKNVHLPEYSYLTDFDG